MFISTVPSACADSIIVHYTKKINFSAFPKRQKLALSSPFKNVFMGGSKRDKNEALHEGKGMSKRP